MNSFTPPSETTPSHPNPSKNIKRSFDVAFLMAPDEKLAQRRRQEKAARQSCEPGGFYPQQSAFTKVCSSNPQPEDSSSQSERPTYLLHYNRTHLYPPFALPPPALFTATFGLPAQNVCAKCNVGFRMTSDLVYHMRSHHKEVTSDARRVRDKQLRCPVCAESFRERHHLTRHMTAHQDKAGDYPIDEKLLTGSLLSSQFQ